LKEQVGAVNTGRISFVFDEARKPGLYLLEFTRRGDQGSTPAAARPEQRAFVFNVDTNESDLRRAGQEQLERAAGGVKVRTPGSGWANELAHRQNDLSESAWLYLFILVVLVLEQALAVHLSFHVTGPAQETRVRTAAPQPSAA
jgi:hypothetical protein